MKRRAFISVYEKSGLIDFARNLTDKFNFEIVSDGDTYDLLKKSHIEVTSIEEYGQVGKATAWISGTNASATAEGKTNNPSYTQASTNSLSYTFNSSGTAAVYLSVSAMRENAANSSSGVVYGEVSNIVIRNP